MQLLKTTRNLVWLLAITGAMASCNVFKKKHDQSTATGWNYNDKEQGNFHVAKPKDIKTAPGLVFIQGGTFSMGATQEDEGLVIFDVCVNCFLYYLFFSYPFLPGRNVAMYRIQCWQQVTG